MGWRDRYLPARFRGVPFHVEAHEKKFARRVVVHEFPGADGGESEDLGRRPGEFSITAYLVGDQHDLERESLIRACWMTAGPGELIHPYLGTRTVVFLEGTVSEQTSEGRVSRLTLTFREVRERQSPTRRNSARTIAKSASTALQDAAVAALAEEMVVVGVPEFVRAAAVQETWTIARGVEALDVTKGPVEKVAELRALLVGLLGNAEPLVQDPRRLAEEIRFTLLAVAAAAGEPDEGIEGYLALLGLLPRASGGTTPLDLQADANAAAVISLARRCALAGAVELSAQRTWETRTEALDSRERLADEIDDQADKTESDAVYVALGALRAALTAAVPPEDQDLPELQTITLGDSLPSLVLAYELYENATREAEIITRNRIRHPGFVPAATPLQVLQDVE
jgi:prophage DNA circulation protein